MATCDSLLAASIAPDCNNPQVSGMEADGVLINRADIDFDSCVIDTTNPNIITTIALKTGKKGYKIYQQGNTPYNGTNTAFTAGTILNKFTKQLNFVIYDHSADASLKIVDQLANGSFVAVVKNKYAGSDNKSRYEVIGYHSGLKQTEGSRDPNSADTEGGWSIAMQETSPKSGMFMFNTDLATTTAAFESLLA